MSIRLITRGDDAGLCPTANIAIRDACEQGILRNVSMMVPTPHIKQAADLFRIMPGIDLGLHVDLTAEWLNVKWGPVAPVESVASLVNVNEIFPQNCQDLDDQGARLEHMQIEITAQLRKARDLGLHIAYLDEHMGVGWVNGLSAWLDDFCCSEGLINNRQLLESGAIRGLPLPDDTHMDAPKRMIAGLQRATPGTYLLVGHPVYKTEEMQAYTLPGIPAGIEAQNRNEQRRWFMDPAVVTWCEQNGIQPIRYSDAVQ